MLAWSTGSIKGQSENSGTKNWFDLMLGGCIHLSHQLDIQQALLCF